MNSKLTSIALMLTGGLLSLAQPATAQQPPGLEPGVNLGYALFMQAYVARIEFDEPTETTKSQIGNEVFYYGAGTVNPSHVWVTDDDTIELGAHGTFYMMDDWIDDDQVDEHSIYVKSRTYGQVYFGEDDGAFDKLAPPRAGHASVSVGQGAFTGCLNWWCNHPFAGGTDRGGERRDAIDWADGIPGGEVRAGVRDTGDAIKLGYISPKLPLGPGDLVLGASVNFQETAAGDDGTRGPHSRSDEYFDLQVQDEFELGSRWMGRIDAYEVGVGLGFVKTQPTSDPGLSTSQDGVSVGFRVGREIPDIGRIRGSFQYDWQKYAIVPATVSHHTDQFIHFGLDWSKGPYSVGANYVHGFRAINARGLGEMGGDWNQAASLGFDYKVYPWMTLGGGVAYGNNDNEEEALEVGAAVTILYRDLLHLGEID